MRRTTVFEIQNLINKMQSVIETGILIDACGYCRYSSDNQREESIEAQQRIISEYAKQNGYNIVRWYIDRAYSGKTVNRPDFQRLLNDIKSDDCPFTAIIVHKTDRFSRNAADALRYKDILRDNGIELVSTTESIKDDANGKLIYGIKSLMNQFYSDNLANEVMKGLVENALKKKWNGGIPPLGYDVVNQELVINETEAVIVRKIFEMAANGSGYNTIIKEMNACGYLTKAGNQFGKNSLYDLLQNEKYKGVYLFNKRAKRNSQNKRNNRKYKDPSEIIRIEDGCPAIVSKDLWERANSARKMMGKVTTNAKTTYLLSGLLHCGVCECKMHGNHRKYGENGYNTYKCNKQANQLACDCKEIRADVLEEYVIDTLTEHFFNNPEIIDTITDEVNLKIREALSADREDIQNARNSLNGLKLARSNLIEAIAQTGVNKAISDKLDNIEKQITEYESIIANDESAKANITVTRDDVKSKIDNLKEHMMNPKNADQTKLLLQSYIDKIVVDNNSVKVIFKVAFDLYYGENKDEVCYFHTDTTQRKVLVS